ncbi:MAG: OsmC family peroxiredoxin [Alphaproteobacteria bacterium]
MSVRSTADAVWNGSLQEGSGQMRFGGGAYQGDFTFASRFETGNGTNPEELIAAAHAGCFSMQLSGLLSKAGTPPVSVRTRANVTIEAGVGIAAIELETEAEVPGIDAAVFEEVAQTAREICPVSQALAAVDNITVKAKLV